MERNETSLAKQLLLVAGVAMLLVLLIVLAIPKPAHAQEPVLKAFVGANGLWYDSQELVRFPSDFELGANLRASLSPHISAVAAGYRGVNHEYWRGSAGLRFTVTDVNNPNLSLGLGGQYHFSDDHSVRPEEFAPDVSLGWVPWPTQPRVVLVGQAGYGLQSQQAWALAGLRLAVWQGVNR
jgi:hypothetical protein